MRFFDESTDKKATETLILINNKEAQLTIKAIEEYAKNNKNQSKAKKLLEEMNKKWNIY